jgi:uncharacterized protein (TIGR00369 family)
MSAEFEKLMALMPFAGHLGITLVEVSNERVVADLPWAPQLCTSGGVMHGGVLMSLADTIGAIVVVLGLAEGEATATITSTTQMFRPVTGGVVRAVAIPVYQGRTTATVHTSLYNADGKLVSQTTQVQAIRPA